MDRYAIVQGGKIVGVVNWDGVEEHPYGAVDLRGPVPENATLEQLMGKLWSEIERDQFERARMALDAAPVPERTVAEQEAIRDAMGGEFPNTIAGYRVGDVTEIHTDGSIATRARNSLDHDHDGHPGGSLPAEPVNPPMTAEQLTAAAEATPTMPWFTFKAEAKRILGEDMPEKKPDIIAALKKSAERNPA